MKICMKAFLYMYLFALSMPQTADKKPKVIVYSTPSCPYCTSAKQFLKEHNIPYEDIDVRKEPDKAQEMIEKSGQMGVPVLDINGTIIVGFDKEAIKKALKLKS